MVDSSNCGPRITLDELNRATLARQFLLERTELDVPAVLDRLVGLQAQTPHTWYVGLFTRIKDFQAVSASSLLETGNLVRIAVMRSTIHLLNAQDAFALRSLVQPVLDRGLRSGFGRLLGNVDQESVVDATSSLFVERSPLTFKEIGLMLAERWPETDAHALSMVARHRLNLVQVPPRGLWRTSGPVAHLPLELWSDEWRCEPISTAEMIKRYLAAFGPATVSDMQTWSGLTRLKGVVTSMEELLPLTGPGGEQLWDLPDAPRPRGDVPAPVRFLYDYDNLLLSHRDRSRFTTDEYTARDFAKQSTTPRLVLVHGRTAATWKNEKTGGHSILRVSPLRALTRIERVEVETEGQALGAFLDEGDIDVIIDSA